MNKTLANETSVAVVHGNYLRHGGGEYVAEQIARLFDAPLYYGFSNPGEGPPDDIESYSLFDDRLVRFLATRSHKFRDLYYMFAWQYVPELYEYDVIIQSGNEMGWFVPRDTQTVVKYVHSTPRTLYDRFPDRGDSTFLRFIAPVMRTLYLQNLAYPDAYIANSELIQRRLNRYWGIESEVVYPPIDVDSFYISEKQDFYLTYSRLVPNKCIDEIIRAFKKLPDQRLIVGGSGPQEEELREMAPDNVEFRGFLSEEEKRNLLSRAKALIFAARNEDFGMVPIEGLASGTPVIGVNEGFTKLQIEDGITGVIFDRGVSELVEAIHRFETDHVEANPEELRATATKYRKDVFEQKIRSIVTDAINSSNL